MLLTLIKHWNAMPKKTTDKSSILTSYYQVLMIGEEQVERNFRTGLGQVIQERAG